MIGALFAQGAAGQGNAISGATSGSGDALTGDTAMGGHNFNFGPGAGALGAADNPAIWIALAVGAGVLALVMMRK